MRMFQSVSRHSSEQSTAYFCSRPTVSQLKLIWESPNTKDTNFHRHTIARFHSKLESNGLQIDHNRKFSELVSIQNSNRMASRLTTIASFPSVFFQLLQYSRQHPSVSAHWAALMTKIDLNFPAISLGFVDFAVQFCFHCKFSFHEKRRSSQVWQWRDFPGPITILCYA